ncbi:MAG: alpha/beta hydrolase [Clostridia bacterium]|nr:alpha/beta hydrolase [Clostridia bacterium]
MQLWNNIIPHDDPNIEFKPYITPYLADGAKLAVVICPGGGYGGRAGHEGKDYAEFLQKNGISAVVLEYRVYPYHHPAEGSDVQRAIRVVRHELAKLGVEKVGVMGSSAGGHLAATASVHYDKLFYDPTDEIDEVSARPDFTILCYAVLDFGKYGHGGTRYCLLGENPTDEQIDYFSLQKQVTENTPPAFLWHTSNDGAVPLPNSLMYAAALYEHNVPCEMHVYPDGPHGLGLAPNSPYVARWSEDLIRWLNNYVG